MSVNASVLSSFQAEVFLKVMTEFSPRPLATLAEPAALLRALPSVDAALHASGAQSLLKKVSRERLTDIARRAIDELRTDLRADSTRGDWLSGDTDGDRAQLLGEVVRRMERVVNSVNATSLRRVINATGVILHTNLGRAPLSAEARRRLSEEVAGYCTLEYDLATGERGRRAPHVEDLLVEITGAEAAFVVNNCAAATLLVLAALASDGETIISRGELVEIGGDFRIPDVMRSSNTRMVEVGTTNRTRLADYEQALTESTRLICRVHPSNFRVVGFTAQPTVAELASLAHKHGVPLYEDAGSGLFYDLTGANLSGEPVISESVRGGADVISFSGDKLLGGPQAGIIVGRRTAIERIRHTPLARALRADKLVLGALEATLEAHARGTAQSEVPALQMMGMSYAETQQRAEAFLINLRQALPDAAKLHGEVVPDEAAIGGGSAPLTRLPTASVAIRHHALSVDNLAERLRRNHPPVIARIVDDRVLLNLRTLSQTEEAEVLAALAALDAAEN